MAKSAKNGNAAIIEMFDHVLSDKFHAYFKCLSIRDFLSKGHRQRFHYGYIGMLVKYNCINKAWKVANK
jgi:hypothetical protein